MNINAVKRYARRNTFALVVIGLGLIFLTLTFAVSTAFGGAGAALTTIGVLRLVFPLHEGNPYPNGIQ